MSYPEELFHGDKGEVSARLWPGTSAPDLVIGGRTNVHYLATGASTGGQYGLYRWDMGSKPGGPGPHFHRTMSESFFVLSGTVGLYDGERSAAAPLPVRPAGRDPRVPQPGGGRLDADPLRSGRTARVLLRGTGADRGQRT